MVKTTLPDDQALDNSAVVRYDGFETRSTNAKGHNKTETKNALGELQSVEDHLGTRVSYFYDHVGNSVRVSTSADDLADSIDVVISYDSLGRKRSMTDPDKGTWRYTYNGFGELRYQTNANGQTVETVYDQLGRMVRRIDPDSDSRWEYNNGTSGTDLGLLKEEYDTVSEYRVDYVYDGLSRLSEKYTTIDGYNYGEKTTYDQFGRTFQVFDAAGDLSFESSGVQHQYNAQGYLSAIVDAVHVGDKSIESYYRVLSMNVWGKVAKFAQGNGIHTTNTYRPDLGQLQNITATAISGVGAIVNESYDWDVLGNLNYRHDQGMIKGGGRKNLIENYDYDDLNRLTDYYLSSGAAKSVSYNSIGNILTKSDVGDYEYGDTCGDNKAGPHAVCRTSDGVSYRYDANGNMLGDSSGRQIEYTSFDKPSVITAANGHRTEFAYNTARARYKREDTKGNETTTTTHYLGSVERIQHADGKQEYKRYIGDVAIVTVEMETDERALSSAVVYLHKDHLGSIVAITNADGLLTENMSFDPWGQRRNDASWAALSSNELIGFDHSTTTRGFTGHEMLDEVGLVHMNGRIYDPRLGRFVQADPHVDGTTDTQGYNRYAYVRNKSAECDWS